MTTKIKIYDDATEIDALLISLGPDYDNQQCIVFYPGTKYSFTINVVSSHQYCNFDSFESIDTIFYFPSSISRTEKLFVAVFAKYFFGSDSLPFIDVRNCYDPQKPLHNTLKLYKIVV